MFCTHIGGQALICFNATPLPNGALNGTASGTSATMMLDITPSAINSPTWEPTITAQLGSDGTLNVQGSDPAGDQLQVQLQPATFGDGSFQQACTQLGS